MRSHFTLSNRTVEFTPPSDTQPSRAKAYRKSSRAALAFAVSGATAMMAGVCSAQIAADFATNPIYAGGWAPGQNGGFGFGAWSFNNTDPTPPAGPYQSMSSASALGTAWTLLNYANNTGLANAGRAIGGPGLLPGQTFETFIQNPGANNFFRGFDILFTSGPDNNAPGNNAAAIRLSVFNYGTQFWGINDTGSTSTPISAPMSAALGMKIDLTLTSPTTYSVLLTPLNGNPAYSHSGTFAGPITYVDYREWDTASAGPNDVPNNFEINGMTISVPEPSSLAMLGLGTAGLMFFRRRK